MCYFWISQFAKPILFYTVELLNNKKKNFWKNFIWLPHKSVHCLYTYHVEGLWKKRTKNMLFKWSITVSTLISLHVSMLYSWRNFGIVYYKYVVYLTRIAKIVHLPCIVVVKLAKSSKNKTTPFNCHDVT